MTKMVQFEDQTGGRVFVNPERVTHVADYRGNTPLTNIHVGCDKPITVKNDVEWVAARLAE